MTKYEKLHSRLQNLYKACVQAKDEEMKNIWWLQYRRLEFKMNFMTIREAMEEA